MQNWSLKEKILSVVVPTYMRTVEVNRCLGSILLALKECESNTLQDIEVLVSNNGGSTLEKQLLDDIASLVDVVVINRAANVGLKANVCLASERSSGEYFLWVTDDDLLLPHAIKYIYTEIRCNRDVSFFWGKLPTFDVRDGSLVCIASDSFPQSQTIDPSVACAIQFCTMGWALTRQIYRRRDIDFERYINFDNAYFCILMAADMLSSRKCRFLDVSYVHHSYFNHEYWDEWGADLSWRGFRIACDEVGVLGYAFHGVGDHDMRQAIRGRQLQTIQNFVSSPAYQKCIDSFGVERMRTEAYFRFEYNRIEKSDSASFIDLLLNRSSNSQLQIANS